MAFNFLRPWSVTEHVALRLQPCFPETTDDGPNDAEEH